MYMRTFVKKVLPGPRFNYGITHPEVRVIDEQGNNLGVFPASAAIKMAQERGLDLVEMSAKAHPPVARIMEVGKYLYQKSKEDKKHKQKKQELKQVRIGLKTGKNDLTIKAGKVDEFLAEGNPVEIQLFLKGRERQNKDFARKKLNEFFTFINTPYKKTMETKASPRGFVVQITKA